MLILNGLEKNKDRSKESERLVKIGLNQFKPINIFSKNEKILDLQVWGGTKDSIGIYSKDKISLTIPNRLKRDLSYSIKSYSPLIAPIKRPKGG